MTAKMQLYLALIRGTCNAAPTIYDTNRLLGNCIYLKAPVSINAHARHPTISRSTPGNGENLAKTLMLSRRPPHSEPNIWSAKWCLAIRLCMFIQAKE